MPTKTYEQARNVKYTNSQWQEAQVLYAAGYSLKDIADQLKIKYDAIMRNKKKHPENWQLRSIDTQEKVAEIVEHAEKGIKDILQASTASIDQIVLTEEEQQSLERLKLEKRLNINLRKAQSAAVFIEGKILIGIQKTVTAVTNKSVLTLEDLKILAICQEMLDKGGLDMGTIAKTLGHGVSNVKIGDDVYNDNRQVHTHENSTKGKQAKKRLIIRHVKALPEGTDNLADEIEADAKRY